MRLLNEYLNYWYEDIEQRKEVTTLNLARYWGEPLGGEIELFTFVNLEQIYLAGNNFRASLYVFSSLVHLKVIHLGNNFKKIGEYNEFNNFFGSLKELANCVNLEVLVINNQVGIKEGLEYLPSEKLRRFECKGTVFEKQLALYKGNVRDWKTAREENIKLLLQIEKEREGFLETTSELNSRLRASETQLQKNQNNKRIEELHRI